MSDYDAFGRKRDESGHDDLGWGTADADVERVATPPTPSTPDSAFSGQPDFTPVSTASPTTSSTSFRVGRSRGLGCVPALLVVLAIAGGGIYVAVDAGRDAFNTARDTLDQLSPNGGGGGGIDRGDDTVPGQVGARKFFTAEGLRSALKVMEREVPGKIVNFSIGRDYIGAHVVRGGRRRVVYFAADAEVPDVQATVSDSGVSDALSYEQINPTAPARLMKAANARVNRSEADVDYFVVSVFSGDVTWGVYYEGGKPIAQGDSSGRYLRRVP
ncbi:MAG: hypothetical protein WKF94_15625 [Solirubrobacteraceae bacterium]